MSVLGLLVSGAAALGDPLLQPGHGSPARLIAQSGGIGIEPGGLSARSYSDRTAVRAPAGPRGPQQQRPLPREVILGMARAIATSHGVDPLLVEAVIWVESTVRPEVVSARGASGLMQLLPRTAERFGITDVLDPAQNIEGGVRYLASLLDRYDHSVPVALAAYNAGESAADRHRGIPPYRVTRAFVRQVLTRYRKAGGMAAAGFKIPPVESQHPRTLDEECRPIDFP